MHQIKSRGIKRLLLSSTFWRKLHENTISWNIWLKLWTLQQGRKKMLLPRNRLKKKITGSNHTVKLTYCQHSNYWLTYLKRFMWIPAQFIHTFGLNNGRDTTTHPSDSDNAHQMFIEKKSTGTAVENAGVKLMCNEREIYSLSKSSGGGCMWKKMFVASLSFKSNLSSQYGGNIALLSRCKHTIALILHFVW